MSADRRFSSTRGKRLRIGASNIQLHYPQPFFSRPVGNPLCNLDGSYAWPIFPVPSDIALAYLSILQQRIPAIIRMLGMK